MARGVTRFAALLIVALTTGVASASGPTVPGKQGASGQNASTVIGSVWDAQNQGIANAQVRVRNVATGKIEATLRADAQGRFTVQGLEGGNYVVELVNAQGKVLAIGPPFTVARGETVATFVRLTSRIPGASGFFHNAAASAVATAATLGVTALTPGVQCASPDPDCR
jgi:hypothetical protein